MDLRLLATFLAATCGGSPSPSPSQPAPAERPLAALCEQHYARERECSDAYLAELVRVRVELDLPRGIAATDAADGRDATIAGARADWEPQSQPAARTAICDALDDQIPADQVSRYLAHGEHCLGMATCDEFAVCAVADERSYIESNHSEYHD